MNKLETDEAPGDTVDIPASISIPDDGSLAHDPGWGSGDLDTGAITRVETTSDAASAAIPSADPAGDDHVALPVAFDGSHDDQADAADTEEDAGATSVASGPGGMSWRRSVHLATWVIGM